VDERVFIYLRLSAADRVLARSKIREFGAVGASMAQILNELLRSQDERSGLGEIVAGGPPVLEYVDANSGQVLIRFSVDMASEVQIVEGCIPPSHQPRMLDPEASAFSTARFLDQAAAGLPEDQREAIADRLAGPAVDLLERIRETLDAKGNFLVRIPWRGP
jgi:hypothetical protein